MSPRAPADWPSLAALFVAALVIVHRWSGDSPALWLDTLNDQDEVRRCVLESSCTLLGQAASIAGTWVGGGWLSLRALLYGLGLDLDAVHLLLQALDALGVALVALAGFRLRSRPVGAVAAFVLVHELGRVAATRQAVYNTQPLSFLGAVLLLACVAAVERPGLRASAVTALLGAVLADFHVAGAAAGATVVWVALLPPGRRVLRAAVTAVVFAAATFAIAPLAWIENVRFLLHAGGAPAGALPTRAPLAAVAASVSGDRIAVLALVGVGAWLFSLVARRESLRRALDVPVAVTAPLLVAYLVAIRHGVPDSGGKYLAHIKPAAALSLAIALGALASWLAERAPPLLARLRPAPERRAWAARLSPWAAALAIVLATRTSTEHERGHFPLFTMGDIDAVARVLRDERGWTWARVRRRLETPDPSWVLPGLLYEARGGWRDPPPPAGADGDVDRAQDDDGTAAVLLSIRADELPDPLPPGWTVARRTTSSAAVILFTPSSLDWRRFELCAPTRGGRRCIREGDTPGEGAATLGRIARGQMVLRVPVREAPAAPTSVFMPRLSHVCAGRILAVPPGSRLDPDGRHALLAGGPGVLELAWDLFSPGCPEHLSHFKTPFFLETAAADAAPIENVLRSREP